MVRSRLAGGCDGRMVRRAGVPPPYFGKDVAAGDGTCLVPHGAKKHGDLGQREEERKQERPGFFPCTEKCEKRWW